jgi:Holliday junction resolvase RusA-like endonuclease
MQSTLANDQIFTCTIPGDPVAQARPRATRFEKGIRLYDTTKVADYKSYAKLCIAQVKPAELFSDAVEMQIDVYVQKPKSWSKKRIYAETKPDADNFCKLICDTCEGLVYTNDSRIVDLHVRKHLSDNPRVEIEIKAVRADSLLTAN